MERRETEAALRLLHAVAMADGSITADERSALAAVAESLGAQPEPGGAVDLAKEASCITSNAAKIVTFEAAVALAAADGRCSPEEHAILEWLRDALGLSLPLPVSAREERWEGRMRSARSTMHEAEVDFLHAIAKRTKTGMPRDEYEGLVEA
ncbi:MAG: hypothetical protein JST00_33685, partial [Deltaproteobacteria bacterium]|nr:hypothetical protein [Deltaproteobacteria bacterium]